MGTSYTRQSSFSNGDVIDAPLFNAEYNQLVAAFAQATGHSHDGTAGTGAYVPLISDPTAVTKVLVDVSVPTDHKLTFVIDGVTVMQFSELTGLSISGTFNQNVTSMKDVANTPLAEKFLKWVDIGGGDFEVRYVDVAASVVTYSNTTSGLTATKVQAALDEIDANVDSVTSAQSVTAGTVASHGTRLNTNDGLLVGLRTDVNTNTANIANIVVDVNEATAAAQVAQAAAEVAQAAAETAEDTAVAAAVTAQTAAAEAQAAAATFVTDMSDVQSGIITSGSSIWMTDATVSTRQTPATPTDNQEFSVVNAVSSWKDFNKTLEATGYPTTTINGGQFLVLDADVARSLTFKYELATDNWRLL